MLSKEQKIHNFLSDIFMVTNDPATNANLPAEKKKTLLYEYLGGENKLFTIEGVDDLFMYRLPKNKDENKFIYLI